MKIYQTSLWVLQDFNMSRMLHGFNMIYYNNTSYPHKLYKKKSLDCAVGQRISLDISYSKTFIIIVFSQSKFKEWFFNIIA